MSKRTIRQTVREHPEVLPDAARVVAAERPGMPARLAPNVRREASIRRILAKGRDPLGELAKLMAESADPVIRLRAAAALAPYLYPTLRATEISGPGGEALTVEVHKVAS